MTELTVWFERKFKFEFPVELYPKPVHAPAGRACADVMERLESFTGGVGHEE